MNTSKIARLIRLVILDLPDQKKWSDADFEMSISLAATICSEQARTSGSRFLLAIATTQPVIIVSRSHAGFREEALDALATCEKSARASLDDVVAAVVCGHSVVDERMIVITPRPEAADASLMTASETWLADTTDLRNNTTLIEARREQMLGRLRNRGS